MRIAISGTCYAVQENCLINAKRQSDRDSTLINPLFVLAIVQPVGRVIESV
jgi:hypothetical protein